MPPIRRWKSITASSGKRSMHEINHEPCPVCGFVVRNKCDIARHQRQHAENKEELMTHCPWPDCEYKSLQRSNVTVHARKRHNWEIHHCRPTCKFSAVLKKDLAQHKQEVHGTKCTITEWEAEGPIDPDRAPRQPCNKKQKSKKILDTLPSEEQDARYARHLPTFPRTICYLERSFDDVRDAAYRCGAYSDFSAWLLWNQWQMFQRLAHDFLALPPLASNPSILQEGQQPYPAQRQWQPQLSWDSVVCNTIPRQEWSHLRFSFENPSSSFIAAQHIRKQLQMWNSALKNTIHHHSTVHCHSTIPESILGGLPVPSKNVASSFMPAQQQLQQPTVSDPEVENMLYSRFPLTYKAYKELQMQQQLSAQQQQKSTRNPVMKNTAVPGTSVAFKTLAPNMGAKLDALGGMEHLSSWDDVASPTSLDVDYDNAPVLGL